ncbi:MAG: hypothetical protein M1814_001908 [Vezdaea aestivalis]|nr:MAG: hypothetical protein M1814_001908 [Vezdaea aestivalis]
MTSKLIPADPSAVTVIRKVTPNITTLSAPFTRFGLIKVGGRGTLVRMTNGQVAVFSPTALTPEAKTAVTELGGKVGYIAALDFEHHIFLGPWAAEYPSAKVLGPEGLAEKRAEQKNENVPFAHIFTEQNKRTEKVGGAFDEDFEYEYVGGHANKELVFLYKPDKTLIQADMLFNLPATEQYSKTGIPADAGIFTKLFSFFNRTSPQGQVWQQRFLWNVCAKDKPSFADSCKRIASWNFEKMIPCHGDVIETGSSEVFKRMFAWHLEGKK